MHLADLESARFRGIDITTSIHAIILDRQDALTDEVSMMQEGILIRQRDRRVVRSVSDADAEVFRQIAARPEAYRAEYSQLPPPICTPRWTRSFRNQQGYVFRNWRRIRIQCRLYHLPMSIGALVIALERRYNPRFYLARWVQTASLSDLPETHRMVPL